MTVQNEFVNEWHNLVEELGEEHYVILRQTLNTPSFENLLNLYAREKLARLQDINLNDKTDAEFKARYKTLKMQSEFAESLAHFVKTLNQ